MEEPSDIAILVLEELDTLNLKMHEIFKDQELEAYISNYI